MKKNKCVVYVSRLMFISIALASCNVIKDSFNEEKESDFAYTSFTSDKLLKAEGSKLVDQKGNEVVLKGVNLGGYLVTEQWMSAVSWADGDYKDHKSITETFEKRFSKETTVELWEYFRENFFNDLDFQNCQDMGMNVIRLPFTYMSVDPTYSNVRKIEGEEFNFSILDSFVSKASEYGMYTILDLHGAYGSQNGQDHSGESLSREEVDFYSNQEKKEKTLHLWKAVSEHFKDNPSVAGYDLLNEPGEKAESTTVRHFDYMDELYKGIRENGDDHLVIFESCWDGANLPSPKSYNWNNVMYSFHNYSGLGTTGQIVDSMRNKIQGVEAQNFDVPMYMGEFTCYGDNKAWDEVLSYFDSKKWSYTPWTYKINRKSESSYTGWGIYYSMAELVDPENDSIEEIKRKWYMVDTAYEKSDEMILDGRVKLSDIYKKHMQS